VPVVTRLLWVSVLLSLLTGLPLAYADLPDPTSTATAGVWDDDDFDNVVEIVTALCAVPAPPIPCERPLWRVIGYAEPVWHEPVVGTVVRVARTRAPPDPISPH
jgi:hypothetical protein